jgi:hypothetical protein
VILILQINNSFEKAYINICFLPQVVVYVNIKQFRDEKGSSIVEAAIIFPLIFLVIMAVIYISIIFYQRTYIRAAADLGAKRAASVFDNQRKDFATGAVKITDLGAGGLYQGIYDFNEDEKIRKAEETIKSWTSGLSIIKSVEETVKVEPVNYIIYKKIRVDIEEKYHIPFGKFLSIFGMSEYFTIKASSEETVNSQAEFIRNVDFLIEVENELAEKNKFLGSLNDKYNSFLEQANKMQKIISDFAK